MCHSAARWPLVVLPRNIAREEHSSGGSLLNVWPLESRDEVSNCGAGRGCMDDGVTDE